MLSGVLGVSHPGECITVWKGCLHRTYLKNEAANIARASLTLGVYTFTHAMNQRTRMRGFVYVSKLQRGPFECAACVTCPLTSPTARVCVTPFHAEGEDSPFVALSIKILKDRTIYRNARSYLPVRRHDLSFVYI